nr:hypothetical protein [Tanacetum cinerariifolium]
MSRMDYDLFTNEVEISGLDDIPCDLNKEDDSGHRMTHGSDDDMEYDPGDDEVKLTDEESSDSDDEDKVFEIFRIDTNVFDFKTPACKAFKEFNYLFWKDDGYCNGGNFPRAYIVGNILRYQGLKCYEALEDPKLKDEALKNKAIVEGMIADDDESHNIGWKR